MIIITKVKTVTLSCINKPCVIRVIQRRYKSSVTGHTKSNKCESYSKRWRGPKRRVMNSRARWQWQSTLANWSSSSMDTNFHCFECEWNKWRDAIGLQKISVVKQKKTFGASHATKSSIDKKQVLNTTMGLRSKSLGPTTVHRTAGKQLSNPALFPYPPRGLIWTSNIVCGHWLGQYTPSNHTSPCNEWIKFQLCLSTAKDIQCRWVAVHCKQNCIIELKHLANADCAFISMQYSLLTITNLFTMSLSSSMSCKQSFDTLNCAHIAAKVQLQQWVSNYLSSGTSTELKLLCQLNSRVFHQLAMQSKDHDGCITVHIHCRE